MKGHRLVLTDRNDAPGVSHIHRWHPSCTCGWHGVHRRTEREAAVQHHAHVESEGRQWKRARRGRSAMTPRPVTPYEELPEVLR